MTPIGNLAFAAVLALGLPHLAAAQPPATPPATHEHGPEPAAAATNRTPAPPGAYAYIGWPNNREVIRSTRVHVWFGLRGMGVAPAETDKPNTGHHHLLVDTGLPPMDQPIPNDKHHLHFGKGQTEAAIDLAPGTHTLQLLLGDAHHVPHNPPVMSRKITIYVRP